MQVGPIHGWVHLFCAASRCSSSVGNQHVGKQRLSIGKNCDRLGTVEHEFLHALGLWHERSRADRDDYVQIVWDQIEPGKPKPKLTLTLSWPERGLSSFPSPSVVFPCKEHNRDDSLSSALGVPYDYGSVMHYSKTSFNTSSEPTIITKFPHFLDVIGHISAGDLSKHNRLYNCSQSFTVWSLRLNWAVVSTAASGAADTIRIRPDDPKQVL